MLTKLWSVPIQLPYLEGEDGRKGDPGQVGQEQQPSQGVDEAEAEATTHHCYPQG